MKVGFMLERHDLDDDTLIRLAKEGDAEAYGELYERHMAAVYRFLYARLDNRMDAEDYSEEVFIKVYNSLATYNERGIPFRAYLLIVARNALIDHYRRNGRAPQRVSIEDMQISDLTPDPGEISSTNSRHQELRKVLGDLREDYQEVLVHRFLNDLSPNETAVVMKRSTGAVRVLQHRALAAVRKALGEKYDQ
jgi:RNA polymerase sigma-70 factor (ECF subfamily)